MEGGVEIGCKSILEMKNKAAPDTVRDINHECFKFAYNIKCLATKEKIGCTI